MQHLALKPDQYIPSYPLYIHMVHTLDKYPVNPVLLSAPLRSNRFQCSRQTSCLIRCLATVGYAILLVKNLCNYIDFFISHTAHLSIFSTVLQTLLHSVSYLPYNSDTSFFQFQRYHTYRCTDGSIH